MKNSKAIKLGEVIELITKGTTPNKKMGGFCLSGINYIKSESIKHDGKIDKDKFFFISKSTHEVLKRSQLKENDILFSMAGAYLGKSAIVTKDLLPANTNQALAIIRIDKLKANPKFINYFFKDKNVIDYINNISGQSAQPNINFEEIKSIDIPFFSLRDQGKIVSLLSSLDDKIDLLYRQNKTLGSMAETLFRQWFIEEAQDEWPEKRLNQYVELNKSSIGKSYNFKEIQYLDTGSLTRGKISELQTMLLSEAPSRAKRLVNDFDIIISTVRPDQCHYGICIDPPSNLVVSTGFCVISSKALSPFFIYYLITSEDMTEYLHSIAEGSTSTYPSLKPEDIGNIPFLYPSEEKLKKFHDLVGSYWNKIHKNQKKSQTLEKLRDTLLPKLMSGEVRVQYAEEAIASVA